MLQRQLTPRAPSPTAKPPPLPLARPAAAWRTAWRRCCTSAATGSCWSLLSALERPQGCARRGQGLRGHAAQKKPDAPQPIARPCTAPAEPVPHPAKKTTRPRAPTQSTQPDAQAKPGPDAQPAPAGGAAAVPAARPPALAAVPSSKRPSTEAILRTVAAKLSASHSAPAAGAAGDVGGEDLAVDSVIGKGGFGVCYKVGGGPRPRFTGWPAAAVGWCC
jgi:hypothetical protein